MKTRIISMVAILGLLTSSSFASISPLTGMSGMSSMTSMANTTTTTLGVASEYQQISGGSNWLHSDRYDERGIDCAEYDYDRDGNIVNNNCAISVPAPKSYDVAVPGWMRDMVDWFKCEGRFTSASYCI